LRRKKKQKKDSYEGQKSGEEEPWVKDGMGTKLVTAYTQGKNRRNKGLKKKGGKRSVFHGWSPRFV